MRLRKHLQRQTLKNSSRLENLRPAKIAFLIFGGLIILPQEVVGLLRFPSCRTLKLDYVSSDENSSIIHLSLSLASKDADTLPPIIFGIYVIRNHNFIKNP